MGADVKLSMLHNILVYGLHTNLRLVSIGHVREMQCGFKLLSRHAERGVARVSAPAPFDVCSLDVEALLLVKQFSVPVAELPIEGHEAGGGKPNVAAHSVHAQRPRCPGWRDYTAAVASCSFMTVRCGLQMLVLFHVITF
ncbi:hypothetical protein BDW22DRAFT_1431617 [Trametopsis cervina]|nr:hypothetical protein BDW22DRAFT_1431617 [Trametopsis cervina]